MSARGAFRFTLTLLQGEERHDRMETSQSIGAESWASNADELSPLDLESVRQEAKSIIAWLQTFLFRSEPGEDVDVSFCGCMVDG